MASAGDLTQSNYIIEDKLGIEWSIPVSIIAYNRAEYYQNKDSSTQQQALDDTVELFNEDSYEIEDWARNNMNWSDVVGYATKLNKPDEQTFESMWANPERTRFR